MSDGGRERAPVAVEVLKSSQKWSVQRSAVRSIAWLGVDVASELIFDIPIGPRSDVAGESQTAEE